MFGQASWGNKQGHANLLSFPFEASGLAKGATFFFFLAMFVSLFFFQHSTFPMFPTDLSLCKLSQWPDLKSYICLIPFILHSGKAMYIIPNHGARSHGCQELQIES